MQVISGISHIPRKSCHLKMNENHNNAKLGQMHLYSWTFMICCNSRSHLTRIKINLILKNRSRISELNFKQRNFLPTELFSCFKLIIFTVYESLPSNICVNPFEYIIVRCQSDKNRIFIFMSAREGRIFLLLNGRKG